MNINVLFQQSFEENFSQVKFTLDKIDIPANTQIQEIVYNMDEIKHSLIFLYFGNAILIRGINPALLQKFEKFLLNFSQKQVLHNVRKLYQITEKYIDIMQANKIGIKAIKIIEAVIIRLLDGKKEFTAIHSQFALLCLKTKMYKASLPIINLSILSFSEEFNVNENDVFTYYYYRGVLFTGLKQYSKAIDSFSTCLNLEISTIYTPQIEAKKKLILLLLLENKKVNQYLHQQQLHFKPVFLKLINIKTQIYLGLLEKNVFDSPNGFENYLQIYLKKFSKDKNLGLAKQIKSSIYLNILKQLRKNYTIISEKQLLTLLNLPAKFELTSLIFNINEIKHIVKINRKINAIEFIGPNEIEYDKVVEEFSEEYQKIKGIIGEFQDAYEVIIKERLTTPDTMYV